LTKQTKTVADIFTGAGRALFNNDLDWPSKCGAALGLSKQVVRDIRRDHLNPAPEVLAELLEAVTARRAALQQAEDELRAWLERHGAQNLVKKKDSGQGD
jgi:hypothetical protein